MDASRDQNFVTTLLAVSSVDGVTPVTLYANPTTHRLLVDLAGGGSGTVQTVAVASANGFAGSSDGNPSAPTLTLSTSVTGILKGNGTAMSAAVANTDYQVPIALTTTGSSGAATFDGTTLNIPQYTGGGGTPGGSTTQVQYNNAGAFGGITGATTNGTTLTLVAPILGTPASATLTNATGLPISTGLTGAGTGVLTALAINVGTAGAFQRNNDGFNGTIGATTPTTGAFTSATATDVFTGSVYLDNADTGTGTRLIGVVGPGSWTVTMPSATSTVATIGLTETLTNKTLTSPVIGTIASNTLILGTGTFTTLTFDAGASDPVITASSGVLTVSTGDLRVTNAGTNTASVVTVGGTQTLTAKTLTSPTINTATIGGATPLAEGASIDLDPSLSADGTYSGIAITGTAGATLAFGDLIYLSVTDSRWELVDADSVTTCGAVLTGMCVLAAAADGNATKILLVGNIRADAAFPALTVGANVYAGLTAGDIVTTAPSATDDVVHVVGKALTADSIYFNPSPDYITIV